MPNLFSTYSAGENRVTATILAVLRSLSLDRMQRLLGELLDQPEFELIKFENQPARGAKGVPDAEISANCSLLIETKLKPGSIKEAQLRRHLKRLKKKKEIQKFLLVLTPDVKRPSVVDQFRSKDIYWASFERLDSAIDDMLEDKAEVVSERESFLLRELQEMMGSEGLIGHAEDVVVVAAPSAWPEYQACHAYVCQQGRSIRPVKYMGFYSEKVIQKRVPEILERHDNIRLEKGKHKGLLGKAIDNLLPYLRRRSGKVKLEGRFYKFILLSAPDDLRTEHLDSPVENRKLSKTGKPTAFTQKQTYVSLSKLKAAKTTDDLT